jgi:xylulokinase
MSMNIENPATVGLDIGTTRTKVVLRSVGRGHAISSVSAPTPVMRCSDGDRRDPYQVMETVTHLLHSLARQRGDLGLADVVGVSAACVGEELVYMGSSGQALGSHRCWYAPGPGPSGCEDRPDNEHASWYALGSDARSRVPQHDRAAAVTDLGSWVLMMLCGSSKPVMDKSHASRTGLLDSAGQWSDARLASCGLTVHHTPHMVDSGEVVGEISASMSAVTGLPEGTTVRAGGHDHLCAALASGARQPGEVFVSVGTSESQLMVLDAPFSELASLERPGLEFGYFTWPGMTYLHSAQPSGRRVSEIVDADERRRSIQEVYEALDAAVPDGAAWQTAPLDVDDPTVVSLWDELQKQATTAETITSQLQEVSGRQIVSKVVSGVPTRHRLWRQLRSWCSHGQVRFDLRDDLSGLGAGLLACPPEFVDANTAIEPTVAGKEGRN